MNTITYCTAWNRLLKEPAAILSADEARRLHESRKPYSAIVENEDGLCVVEMCFFQIYCHVLILDQQLRVATRYSFVEKSTGQLFLKEAAVHYYTENGETPIRGEIFFFKEDGTLIHDQAKVGGVVSRREGQADVRRNYALLPEFGQYDSIIMREW